MKKITTLIVFLTISISIIAQNYKQRKISANCQTVIGQYGTYLNLIGDTEETEQDKIAYSKALYNLFYSPSVSVYNDLDPTGESGEVLSIRKYVEYIGLWYSTAGLVTDMKTATLEVSNTKTNKKGESYVDVEVDKTISGIYLNRVANQHSITLSFQITFDSNDLSIEKFKIARIKRFRPVPPAKPGTIKGADKVKQGKSVTYTVAEVDGAESYKWTMPQGANGNSTTNTINVWFSEKSKSGNISVKAMNSFGSSEAVFKYITVEPLLPDAAGNISGKEKVKQGQKGVLYVVPPIQYADSYQWTLPAGFEGNSTKNNISVNIGENAMSGFIKVKGVNQNGEGKEAILKITVQPQKEVIVDPEKPAQPTTFTEAGLVSGFGLSAIQSIKVDNLTINHQKGISVPIGIQVSKNMINNKLFAGIESGVILNSFKSELQYNNYSVEYSQTDLDGHSYLKLVDMQSVTENVHFSAISVPLKLKIGVMLTDNLVFGINAGVQYSLLVKNQFSPASGTLTVKRYYPAYDLLITDIQELGTVSNSEIQNNPVNLDTKEGMLSLVVQPQLKLYTDKLFFGVSFNIENGQTNLNKNINSNSFSIVNNDIQYQSIIPLSHEMKLSKTGIRISAGIKF